MIAKSRASNSPYAVVPRRPNGPSRRRAWHGSARGVPLVRRRGYAATTVLSSSRDAFVPPVAITVCDRRSSHRIHRSRTASSNASFAVSRKNASGNTTSAPSPKRATPLLSGSIGIIPSALTRPSVIAARGNSARLNPNSWLDCEGALHFSDLLTTLNDKRFGNIKARESHMFSYRVYRPWFDGLAQFAYEVCWTNQVAKTQARNRKNFRKRSKHHQVWKRADEPGC